MNRIILAVRVFFAVLFSRQQAERVAEALSAEPPAQPALPTEAARGPKTPAPKPAPRSDALNLLAALQREGRLVDFLMEPLDGYSDAQIGAAVRDVHRDCAQVIERFFAIRPAAAEAEGASVEVPAGFDPGRYRLLGQVSGPGPFRGRLVHPGWEASRCDLPTWTGAAAAARVIAPIEIEVG